ncbi:MAG: carboxymuconolactone decarboxylase family protein [Spirochaetota bacterium]|nr:carboxymuconolactone decarboxylase family protein [Spirochaetota bacterium]
MDQSELDKKTKETAEKLFSKGIKRPSPFQLWKSFDKELAKDLSRFITGNLYSRTVLSLPERQMITVAVLTALKCSNELSLHINGALNVGCDPQKLAEVIFQAATYAGMPAVNEALEVYKEVLEERGEWPIK